METDVIGYAAACLVLATFSMQSMLALRITAIASNLAFIAYAVGAGLFPVVALHCLLFPLNTWHLVNLLLAQRREQAKKAATAAARPPKLCPWSLLARRHRWSVLARRGAQAPMRAPPSPSPP